MSQIDEASGAAAPAELFDAPAAAARLGCTLAFLAELAQIFLEDCPAMLGEARQAVASRDADKLRREAHLLRGAIGNFTVAAPYDLAKSLEMCGKNSNFDTAPQTLVALEENFDRLVAALKQLIQESHA